MNDRQRTLINEAIVRLADGDREAFNLVFDGLWPHVLSFVGRAVPGHPDREDLAQRTLLNVFARISDFDVRRDGVAWVFGIATYEVKTLRRQIQRRRETAMDDAAERATTPTHSPEEAVILADLRQALDEVLGHLSPDEREALMGEGAAARPTGVTAPAWRKRRQRALDKVRAIWSGRHG